MCGGRPHPKAEKGLKCGVPKMWPCQDPTDATGPPREQTILETSGMESSGSDRPVDGEKIWN